MQPESPEKCSSLNYPFESLKLLYEGAKDTHAFFNGPAYSQQMTNARTFLWLSNLLLSSVFGVIFLLKNELANNPQVNFVLIGFFISIFFTIPCITLCILTMRQDAKFVGFPEAVQYYIDKRNDYFSNDSEAYTTLIKQLIVAHDNQIRVLTRAFDRRGITLRNIRKLLITGFISFIFSLFYLIIILYWNTK